MADAWKKSFVDKLNKVQNEYMGRFEKTLESVVAPVFDELGAFLRENGFKVACPLREAGRRSFKFELAENAYLLMIFRGLGVGEFELRCDMFVPGRDPSLKKSVGRLNDLNEAWTRKAFQSHLDQFLMLLAGERVELPAEPELVAV